MRDIPDGVVGGQEAAAWDKEKYPLVEVLLEVGNWQLLADERRCVVEDVVSGAVEQQ